MPYNRQIPDAPLPISMLPRANALTLQDLLLLTQPGNPQGQRSKALSLQMLAQFLGNMNFDSIVLQGRNGKSLTLTGDGTTFTKPHVSQGDQRDYTIVEREDGITLQVTGPNGTQKILIGYTTLEISSTETGLTQKITLEQNGLIISNQTRVNGEVVTTERKISKDHIDVEELKFFSSDFPKQAWTLGIAKSPDANMKELVLQFAGSETAQRFVIRPAVLFAQHTQFEKDVTINADVTIEKSLKLDGVAATLENKMGATNIKSLYFQTQQRSEYNDTLIYCSNLTISGGSYTLPNIGPAASNVGLFKIVANDTDSSVQVYFRGSLSVTLAPGQAAQFLWNGGNIGWFRF